MINHLGIIADGNRRWAKEQGLPTFEGHRKGLDTLEKTVDLVAAEGVKYLTFYVFSTENWGRNSAEVSFIMSLIKNRILGYAKELKEKNLRFIVLGTKDRLNPKLVSFLEQAERITEDCTGMTVSFCFNYGGEQEIADAAKIAAKEGEITPKTIRKHLYHPEIPNLDMVVRTSGEERISGFMLWRSSYAEFMFIKKYFPDLSAKDIKKIIEEYNSRNRRFGK